MSKKKKAPSNRRQFVAWLMHELQQSGAQFGRHWQFADLKLEIERRWLKRIPTQDAA